MKQLQRLYQKYNNCITNLIFPIMLFLYPLIKVNQGIDVSDTTYSLGNYLFFDRLEGMWVISTYLSNVVGYVLTKLPFGDTLLGMNIYTGLIVSILVLAVYQILRKWMPEWIVFLAEIVAIGFMWIPTTILYNYLTYVLFSIGALLLYKGLVEGKTKYLVIAGICLGCNALVRVSNLAQMALVVCVWYYSYLQKETVQESLKKTGYCIVGYLIGIIPPFIGILMQYGFGGMFDMIQGLSSVQSADDSYSIVAMIFMTIKAYISTMKWVLFAVIGIFLGTVMCFYKKEWLVPVKKLLYMAGALVLLRFYWGRGMFSFRYYEDYSSMYEWGMMGLYLALFACIYLFIGKGVSIQERLLGMVSLVIIVITPLGSNNYTYQNINNLFVVAPITLYAFVKLFRRRYVAEKRVLHFPWKAMVAVLGGMILLQSAGFHSQFVFRDGMDGTKRDTVVEAPVVVKGMYTTAVNAEEISGLLLYMDGEKEIITEAVYFGDCPGLAFLTGVPAAIGSSWPDLDSYSVQQFDTDLSKLTRLPAIILCNVEKDSAAYLEKKDILADYMNAKHYESVYENNGYTVYMPQE